MKRLFVAMPYGVRTSSLDYEEPDKTCVIDFDAVWKGILQPAVPEGVETKRADELRQPGLIDRMFNEWLFEADIVLADLTFANPNVYYELGIRQALSKKGTVLVACKGTKLPFDVRNQYVITYDYFAAPALWSFQASLRQAIENASVQELNSPVHMFLPGLVVGRYQGQPLPEDRIQALTQRVLDLEAALRNQRLEEEEERLLDKIREEAPQGLLRLHQLTAARDVTSVRLLEELARRLRDAGHFDEALDNLERALTLHPDDSELLREMGFVCRKKGPEFYPQAEAYMERSLQLNDQDSELHGMLGGLFRRRGDTERALAQYRRAHELQPGELYPLVTVAAMYGALGMTTEARAWYSKLRRACELVISQGRPDHWTFLCLGEAGVALDEPASAEAAYRKALSGVPPVEHVRSETEQLEFLAANHFAVENVQLMLPLLREYLANNEVRRTD